SLLSKSNTALAFCSSPRLSTNFSAAATIFVPADSFFLGATYATPARPAARARASNRRRGFIDAPPFDPGVCRPGRFLSPGFSSGAASAPIVRVGGGNRKDFFRPFRRRRLKG